MKQTTFLGMQPRVDPTLLPPNTAQLALDADLSRGTLAPFRADVQVTATAPGTVVWMSRGACRTDLPCTVSVAQFTQGCEQVFVTGLRDRPMRATREGWLADDLTWLGLPAPSTAPLIVWGPDVPLRDQEAVPRAFFYTYRNAFGEESAPSPPSATTVVAWDRSAWVGNFELPPVEAGVVAVVVYMLQPGMENMQGTPAGGEASWFEIGVSPLPQAYDVQYTATTRLGRRFDGFEHLPPPTDLRDIQSCGDHVLAGLSDGELHFSEPGTFGAWPDKYRIRFNAEPLRFLATGGFGYVLTCGAPEVVKLRHDGSRGGARQVTTLQEDLPLAGLQAVAVYDGVCFYATRFGLVMLAGPQAKLLTEGLFTQEQWEAMQPTTMRLVVHQGVLFMATAIGTFRWRVPLSLHTAPTLTDFTQISAQPMQWLRSEGELLYVTEDGRVMAWARGDVLQPYYYHTRPVDHSGRVSPSVLKVDTDGPDVHVMVVADGVAHYTGAVPPGRPMMLRAGASCDTIEVVLRGTSTVRGVAVAPSIQDLMR